MYFDSHAHLDSRRFDADREEVLRAVQEAKVSRVMNVGCDEASSRACIALAEQHEGFYAAVGSHPDDAGNFTEETAGIYKELAAHPKVKAIGEIGLDYYYKDNPPEIQKIAFLRQMELAQELKLPVIIHDRDAHGDCLDIIRQFPSVKGVFHCFSGSWEFAQELIKLGWYVGFTGVVTFPNARKALEAVKAVPLDRILAETDCPYMAPVPYRGQRCHSGLVPVTIARLGELKGLSQEEMGRITKENACRLFQI